MWLVATLSDNADKEHFYHCSKSYWTAHVLPLLIIPPVTTSRSCTVIIPLLQMNKLRYSDLAKVTVDLAFQVLLAQCCPKKFSTMIEMFQIFTVQDGSH